MSEQPALDREEHKLIEAIEQAPMVEQVIEWAELNSGSANLAGLEAVATRLAHAFAALPGDVALVEGDRFESVDPAGGVFAQPTGAHLVLKVRPEAPRRILLTGHMDTVYAADHPFQTCDWLDPATLHGPGTADMKGGLALMLAALRAFEASAPRLGYDVMINSDEEIGSPSSAGLIRELAPGKLAALTYEPALPDGRLARARPGSGNVSLVVTGRAAHAGRNPQDGRNAIVAAADLALRLARSATSELSINPARIDGGAANNTVPDGAVLRCNLRPHRPQDLAEAIALLDRLVAEVAAEHDVAIALHGGFGRPPKVIDAKAESLFGLVARAAFDLGERLDWADTGGVCDGNNIAACGVPVIDTMGACGGAIHSPDEFLQVDSLVSRARLSALVLQRLDRGVSPL